MQKKNCVTYLPGQVWQKNRYANTFSALKLNDGVMFHKKMMQRS